MSFNSKDYYDAKSGESNLEKGKWHIDEDRRYAFKVSSDFDPLQGDPSANPSEESAIFMPEVPETTKVVEHFSSSLNQKIKNVNINDIGGDKEEVELELGDRILSLVIDQSGSMTWNDKDGFRHDMASELINVVSDNYPGVVKYNLVEYGAIIVETLFFGVVVADGKNLNSIDSISALHFADSDAKYSGIRVVRNEDHPPTSVIDGEIVTDDFVSKILDEDLTPDKTYYYAIYTYDDNYRFSRGVHIEVTSKERIIPRGVTIFSGLDSDCAPLEGSGVVRDDNTVGIWHLDEGEGSNAFDFSDSKNNLVFNEEPKWLSDKFSIAGKSGVRFNGVDTHLGSVGDFSELNIEKDSGYTVMMWINAYDISTNRTIFTLFETMGVYANAIHVFFSSNIFIIATVDSLGETKGAGTDFSGKEGSWVHLAITFSTDSLNKLTIEKLYVNGSDALITPATTGAPMSFSSNAELCIGKDCIVSSYDNFYGMMSEVSFHNVERSQEYIQNQIITSDILDEENVVVDTEYLGLKEDNGDRLVVLKYNVPEDYNFVGGNVKIIKNDKRIPSWDGDGDIVHDELAVIGESYVTDPFDFVHGEDYFYRIYSVNDLSTPSNPSDYPDGNVSYPSDSPSLRFSITGSTDSDDRYFFSLSTPLDPPTAQSGIDIAMAGNKKSYLRWDMGSDARVSRTKIYHSYDNYPSVSKTGSSSGELIFTGASIDNDFVHDDINNDVDSYYTFVNSDKYGRVSNYDEDGEIIGAYDFLHAKVNSNINSS